jgi:dihydroneopterin aldolase
MLGVDREAVSYEVAHPGGTKDIHSVTDRINSLEVYAHCEVSAEVLASPQTLLMNPEYIYKAQGDHISGVVGYGVLLEGVAQVLEREAFQLLETGIRRVGEPVLERFPEVWKPTVHAKVRVPVARAASGVPVEASSGW